MQCAYDSEAASAASALAAAPFDLGDVLPSTVFVAFEETIFWRSRA